MTESCRLFRRSLLYGKPSATQDLHLDQCEHCRRFCDVETSTGELLRANRPPWQASSELRERITAVIGRERAERGKSLARGPRSVAMALASAVAILVLVASTMVMWPESSPDGKRLAQITAHNIVADHLEYAHRARESLDISSSSAGDIQAHFEGEIQLAVRLPVLSGATLLGGRRCSVGTKPAALVFYERATPNGARPDIVSLFVFEPSGEDFSAMQEVDGLVGKRTCHQNDRGVGLLLWEERGLIYALAGAFERDELQAILLQASD